MINEVSRCISRRNANLRINFLNTPLLFLIMDLTLQYNAQEAEVKWQKYWEEKGIFKFQPDLKKEFYSVDTPPPTISGKMHLGHSFSYSQQDFIVRYQRMKGKCVFYPFGTDNNGVATERLVEKMKNVRAKSMSREDFWKLCSETVEKELKPQYVNDMKRLGLSCDFNLFYDTINKHSQKISQRSFIDLYKKGREYRKDAPTMWCPQCETGISQVECQDKVLDSFFNDIVFKVECEKNGEKENLIIATTRPELLPACVAIFYHPEDKRYQKYKGKIAKVPLMDFEVPILADERADPEKGTGIVMCCTFGDQTDMEWQKAHNLPIKMALSENGRMTAITGKYTGLKIAEARKKIIEDLKAAGLLLSQKPIQHAVNVHERCGTEIEYLKSKQWFIKYLDLKEDMLQWGAELNWYPAHMKVRYDNWVKGLQWDWMISRQRFFGVPFPVWYCKKCDEVILAEEKQLPVDPLKDQPLVKKCPKCGGSEFIPEKDVLDTWATSSLTPNIATELIANKEIQKKIYPMSLRPQAHDIITFWLFNTVVKARLHYGANPWKDVVISGHAQDPHGKKMSKSKGNVVEPQIMIAKFSADALRFWSAGSKLGDDLPFQEKDLVTGMKFTNKLWNSSKFALMHLEDYQPSKVTEVFDHWLLSKLHKVILASTESFDKYEYSRTKSEVEQFFWHTLCDFYMEIIKDRMYNASIRGVGARASAQEALYQANLAVLKMMAPIMPHITEEVYQLYFAQKEKCESVHVSSWPKYDPKMINEKAELVGDMGVDIIGTVRKYRSSQQMSMKEQLAEVVLVSEEKGFVEMIKSIEADLKATMQVRKISFSGETSLVSEQFGVRIGVRK